MPNLENQHAEEFVRYIGKTGDLALVSEEAIQWAVSLPTEAQIELYKKIRDESMRMESEWREEFTAGLNLSDTDLPDRVS